MVMDDIITIDGAGRLVVPIAVRRRLHLVPGCRLRLREQGTQIVLEPIPGESRLVEENGRLVIPGRILDHNIDHRSVREERLDDLTPRP